MNFDHIIRMSDSTGLLEHSRGATPRREHGYCTDDVARGLLVVCREPEPGPELRDLAERYLAFLAHAQNSAGAFSNRLSYDRRWRDHPGTGDWWGRAMWGLGTAAARSPVPWVRAEALTCFEAGATQRSRWPRAMAVAALGAAEVLAAHPRHELASALLTAVPAEILRADRNGRWTTEWIADLDDPSWPWPEPRLQYANAAFPDALIAAGQHTGDDKLVDRGLRMLKWLAAVETRDGHLSVTPTGGWGPDDPRPAFDQQPIEVATLADAFARAYAITGDATWTDGIRRAVGWFLGENDTGAPVMDAGTGGGLDGLGPDGPSMNQGAESTLALISTLQQGREHG